MRRRSGALAAAALACAAAAGCGGGDTGEGPPPAAPATMRLTSQAFGEGEKIPVRYTCDGADASPPLAWDGVPPRARSLALVVEDPDAPDGTFVHWTLVDIPRGVSGLSSGEVPKGAKEGLNSFGDHGYRGPCPPEDDEPHRYEFLIYALKAPVRADEHASPGELRTAIGREAIARGKLTGRFGR